VFATIKRESSKEGYIALPREGSPFFVPKELFLSEHLAEGQELTETEFEQLRGKRERLLCRDKALAYLARREHSGFELRQKLRAKGFAADPISWTLAYLEDHGYLSELRYARALIESRQRRTPEGRIMLSRRLSAKKVNRADAERALDEYFSEEQTTEYVLKAYSVLTKKYGQDIAILKLQERGFSRYEIRRAFEADGDGRE
jgi:regulatory protein